MHTETEVDFVYLAKTIWKRKLLVVKLTGIAAVAGFIISIMIPEPVHCLNYLCTVR